MKFVILSLCLFQFTACAKFPPLKTVENIDLSRYAGKWYEIARLPQWFQKNCINSTAFYKIRKDNDIDVINTCRIKSIHGKLKKAYGKAWIPNSQCNSKLKVQFFLKSLKIPFLAGNYWILDLDKEYQYVLIGDPSRKYLWILARNKEMDDETYNMLISKAKELKFNTSKIIKNHSLKDKLMLDQ